MTAVAVSVRDARAAPADRLWIQSVYRDYLDDLNPGTGLFPAPGRSRSPRAGPDRALVRGSEHLPAGDRARRGAGGLCRACCAALATAAQPRVDYRMAEFFIARARRRLGIGRTAVQLILSRFAGRWEITEYLRNAEAVSFWRRVVAAYTQGSYQERIVNGEVHQVFVSGKPRP